MLIVLAVLMGLSTHMVVNCGDEDDPDICAAVIGFSPLRGSLIAFAYEGRGRIALRHGDWPRARNARPRSRRACASEGSRRTAVL